MLMNNLHTMCKGAMLIVHVRLLPCCPLLTVYCSDNIVYSFVGLETRILPTLACCVSKAMRCYISQCHIGKPLTELVTDSCQLVGTTVNVAQAELTAS